MCEKFQLTKSFEGNTTTELIIDLNGDILLAKNNKSTIKSITIECDDEKVTGEILNCHLELKVIADFRKRVNIPLHKF